MNMSSWQDHHNDVYVLTSLEDGPFSSAIADLLGYDLIDCYGYNVLNNPTAVAFVGRECVYDNHSYYHIALEGPSGKILKATVMRLRLGDDGKSPKFPQGHQENHERFHSARKARHNTLTYLGNIVEAGVPDPNLGFRFGQYSEESFGGHFIPK